MKFHRLSPKAIIVTLAMIALAPTAAISLPVHNVPAGVATATDKGRVDPAREMNLTVVLKLHNRANFDQEVENLFDPASPRYHQWFTDKDFERYLPTPQEYKTVRSELEKQGFKVIATDERCFTIRVHGTAAIVEKAFHTELHDFVLNGRSFQAHIRDARLEGPAGDLVDAVAGIERHQARPQFSILKNPRTGEPFSRKVLSTKESLTSFKNSLTDTPLSVAATDKFNTFGGPPTAKFTGTQYAANGQVGALTPAQLQAHYGVPFTAGSTTYDGTGQRIALVEAYGYPQAGNDAGTAATLFGLPPLTSGNFHVLYPEGRPLDPEAGILTGWDTEIALDIQSTHAIAPGAQILVVASSGQDDEDQLASLLYVINPSGKKGGKPEANVVSSSWENDSEIVSGNLQEEAFNTVLKAGAAAGIAFQFSSGDGGDLGLGTPVGDVDIPSNDPWVTAVGGTSVLNDPYSSNATIVTGWGSNFVYLSSNDVVEDPLQGFFSGGAGGGESQFWEKPKWQKSLPGLGRQVPDVSAVADPGTGFPVIITEGGKLTGEVVGGTSLACPVFSGIWAVADQFNGGPLGQAAPLISKLKAAEISDVVPPAGSAMITKNDVTGSITNAKGKTTKFNARQIFTEAINQDTGENLSLYTQGNFLSAIYPAVPGVGGLYFAISFGTDSSLTVTHGWDNVTGWGEPNGLPFVQGVTGKMDGAVDKKDK
jgi:subtilase family serine protease